MLLKSPLVNLGRTLITLEDMGWPTEIEEENSSDTAETRADPRDPGNLESYRDIKTPGIN